MSRTARVLPLPAHYAPTQAAAWAYQPDQAALAIQVAHNLRAGRNAETLRLLLARAREADIIAGYRARRSDPKHRLINAWAWGRLVKLLFGLDVRDVDCAFKVFHREVFEQVPISSVGAFVNTEILLRAQAEGFTITQVPVSHYPRTAGTSTGANPKVIARAFWELGRLYRELKRALERLDERARPPSGGLPD